jgi:RHS repeat-associated protein
VQAYGGAESDYRPGRWKEFREDYRFTGKEEDVEVGLQYFGARFYAPLLQRWISPDPLTIHGLGGDLNLYAYVRGMALKATDPLGLECDVDQSCSYSPNATQSIESSGGSSQAPNFTPAGSQQPPGRAKADAPASGTGGTGPTIDKEEILSKFDPIVDRNGNMKSLQAPYGGTVTVNLMEERLERLMATGGVQGSSGSGELPEVPRLELKIAEFEPVVIQAAAPGPRPTLALGAGELRAASLELRAAAEGAVPRGGTYVLRDPATAQVMRTGRSGDLARRGAEHGRDPALRDLTYEPVHRTDVYAEQRGLEQLLHQTHQPPLNKIRPISPQNPRLDDYLGAAKRFLEGQ